MIDLFNKTNRTAIASKSLIHDDLLVLSKGSSYDLLFYYDGDIGCCRFKDNDGIIFTMSACHFNELGVYYYLASDYFNEIHG